MLSIIIVNYNVKYFLEQCLHSVEAALKVEPWEIIVFDNASTDGSRAYLEPKFPQVQFVWHQENLGFGKANNSALRLAKGDIILFLNPDTIIKEGCLQRTAAFLRKNIKAGALGVHMVDGNGKYLQESKRAYPSIAASFYKLFGLSALFPRSPKFARYYLGHLDENETQEVDVIAGAFMMVKREVLALTGGFDERFFMYGEDIDLSYRIQQLGYKNYYFAGETIVHFKGKSSRKGSLKQIKIFYFAMLVFVDKYYKYNYFGLLRLLLHTSIVCRAIIGFVFGYVKNYKQLF